MITLEQCIPGTEVIVNGQTTTILTGHYDDQELGPMIKTSLYPGGYPLSKHSLPGEPTEVTETLPVVIFTGVILDEKEPVKFTPELIRTKSADLLKLTIKDIFDEAGLKAVKAAKQKIVKTRTAIEKIEASEKGKMKVKHDAEKKELTDYAETLYAACREGETDLQTKINTHEAEKAAAAKKLDDDKKAKTAGRNAKMFELGMLFNGFQFSNYGKSIAEGVLHAMTDEKYAELLVEIEGLSMEHGVTGAVSTPVVEPKAEPQGAYVSGWGSPASKGGSPSTVAETPVNRVFENEVHRRQINGVTIILTKGKLTNPDDMILVNDRIMESAIYLHAYQS
jgi:hypothetical protein